MAAKALNPKQQRFVAEYLIDLNATQAAIRAGYSKRTAQQIGSRLLLNVVVSAAISEGQQVLAEQSGVTAERIVKELAKLGFSNMQDYVGTQGGEAYVDLSAVNRDQWAAVGEITVDHYTEGRGEEAREVKRTKFKLADKRAALVDLGKHLGMFVERSETTIIGETIDRPPQETRDEWIARRQKELSATSTVQGRAD